LILNPYLVIKRLHEAGAAGNSQEKYNALVERAIDLRRASDGQAEGSRRRAERCL
jgi:hypothetical protein